MPITIDLTDHALYKKGAKDSEIKTKRTAIINMLKRGMPIKDIAEIQEVSIDYVIQIQNELDKK